MRQERGRNNEQNLMPSFGDVSDIKDVVKKHFFSLSLAFLICSIICISFPSETFAASPQDGQDEAASFVQLKATGPVAYGQHIAAEKGGEHDVTHMVSIPVNSGLNAFFDFAKTNTQEITKKNQNMDFRTVFGFHITLQ